MHKKEEKKEESIEIIETEEELQNLTIKNTPTFNFKNEIHYCKVLSCYDGDTIRCAFKHGEKYIQYSIRMLGYNCCEIRSKDETEKDKAIQARDFIREKILGKNIYLVCGKFGKYGRILGTVYMNKEDIYTEQSINKLMVDTGYGVPINY